MKIFLISILVSILWHPLSYLIDSYIEDYDKSTELAIDSQFLKHTLRWDSLFFLEIMENDYRYFKNHAFGYGLPLMGKLLQHSLILLLIIQKLCNAYSSELIYKISLYYTKDKKFSIISSLLFIFTPASVFYHSLYSESYFTTLVLLGIHFQIKQHQYVSSLLFAISIHFRSNGMFYILYSGFPYLQKAYYQLKDKKVAQLFTTVLEALPIAIIYLISISIMLYLPYHNYCHFEMDWCKGIIPYAYGYIQKNFWDVGFLSSYKPRKWFFIFWGVQGLIVQGNWIWRWLRKRSIISISAISIVLPTIIFFFISAFLAHVNCSTRFFSTYITFYWALAELFNERSKKVLFYLIEFNLGGLILYNNYLLWA